MATVIAPTAVIYPGVELGENVRIGHFAVVGCPSRDAAGQGPTEIGDGSEIGSMVVIYSGNVIGAGFFAGDKANIRESNTIGTDVSVGSLSVIEHHVEIADGVRIHSQAFIPEYSRLLSGCWIGPNVVLTNARYPRSADVKRNLSGPTIGRHAKVGANSTLLPGVCLGDSCLIGAGSVVTHDIPDHAVAYGNPATVRSTIAALEAYANSTR